MIKCKYIKTQQFKTFPYSITAPEYTKKNLIKQENNLLRNFNISLSLSIFDRTDKDMSKHIGNLKNTITK